MHAIPLEIDMKFITIPLKDNAEYQNCRRLAISYEAQR